MAGVTPADVDACQLYDCYTYTVVLTLEDYGFCPKGEGGPFVATGALGPGGALPTNTGGGQLSAYYLGGMTPLAEAVVQARGHGGDRQLPAFRRHGRQRKRWCPRLPHDPGHEPSSAGAPPAMTYGTAYSDGPSAPFFNGASEGTLTILRCGACARWLPLTSTGCPGCGGSNLAWSPASGKGTVVSWTVTHTRGPGPGSSPVRRVLALVELAEGPWLHARLVDTDPERLAIGDAVVVSFADAGEAIPVFRAPGPDHR